MSATVQSQDTRETVQLHSEDLDAVTNCIDTLQHRSVGSELPGDPLNDELLYVSGC